MNTASTKSAIKLEIHSKRLLVEQYSPSDCRIPQLAIAILLWMGSCICCGHNCFCQDGAFGFHSSYILVTYDRRTRVEQDPDSWRRKCWGNRIDLRLSGGRLGC